MPKGGKRLAIDVGGTFVDFVLLDETTGEITIEKEPSLRESLPDRIFNGIERLKANVTELDLISHGSTTVINTILQERGASLGLITTKGFRDVLELGRGNRPEVFNLLYKPPKPLISRFLRFEVSERLDHQGGVILSLDEEEVRQVADQLKSRGVEGIAICFLHSYANPQHERRAREICQEVFPGVKVAISSDITGEFREFERTSTVVLNTYVMPRMASYLLELENRLKGAGFSGGLNIMQSTGGMMSSKIARGIPIRTLESGPAGGVIGAVGAGKQLGERNLIAADVGGTSFDVTLIPDGRPLEKAETVVNRRPVLQATLDIVSVGAGGGSIAWIDDEGSFRVGPQSAEADPGPVCFGQGGTEPTVTDAHLVLGTINPFFFLGKRVEMHIEAAQQAIREKIAKPLRLSLEEAAYGITRLADTNMINAIRQVSVERGHDPRDFALFCYGGGGGLFASSLAQELDIPRAIIPPNPAVFSAWGILTSDIREDAVRTWVRSTEDLEVAELIADFGQLANSALEQLQHIGLRDNSVQYLRSVDMRYEGQEHTVRVPVPSDTELLKDGLGLLQRRFDELHEKAYAHASPGTPTEIVNLRCSAVVTMKKPRMTRIDSASGDPARAIKERREVQFATDRVKACPIYDREKLGAGDRIDGPAVIEEWNSTTTIWPRQRAEVDAYANIVIQIAAAS